jgi:hypothetical protein
MSQFLALIEVIGLEKDIGTCQGLQICKYDERLTMSVNKLFIFPMW